MRSGHVCLISATILDTGVCLTPTTAHTIARPAFCTAHPTSLHRHRSSSRASSLSNLPAISQHRCCPTHAPAGLPAPTGFDFYRCDKPRFMGVNLKVRLNRVMVDKSASRLGNFWRRSRQQQQQQQPEAAAEKQPQQPSSSSGGSGSHPCPPTAEPLSHLQVPGGQGHPAARDH